MELLRILEAYLTAGGGPCALATLVETIGPAYRRAGARQLIRRDGKTWGTVTGGCVESDLILRALDVLEQNRAGVVRYSPSDDDPILGLGSGCGGEIVVLLEPLDEPKLRDLHQTLSSPIESGNAVLTVHRAQDVRLLGTRIGPTAGVGAGTFVQPVVPPLSLFLFGASPAAEPLAHIGKQLGWKVCIADHRPIIQTNERLAIADEIIVAPIEELPGRFTYPAPSAAVVMSHHYLRDLELLKRLLPRGLSYVGVVGSRVRAERLLADLRSDGFGTDSLAPLHAPAGLDLGVDAPSEIALSIVAEIQAVQNDATAGPLRDRRGSIHNGSGKSAIVILAAGASRRMGHPKQLIEIGGKSLIRRAAEAALFTNAASIHIIAGAEADRILAEIDGLPIQVTVNDDWEEGIASSIRAAVDAVERQEQPVDTMLLMLCDQPGVTGEMLRRILRTHHATRASVVASRYPDGPGVPALFGAELFPALRNLRGDIGARQLIRQLNREVVTIPFDAPDDVDTPEDLPALRSTIPT